MADDKVYFRNGAIKDLSLVTDTMPFSISLLDKYYEVKWERDSLPFITLVFPAQYDLLLGMQKDEAVNKLKDAGFKEDEIKVGNASYDDRYTYANDVSHITYRYQASQTVTVFTKNLDLVRKVQQTLETELVNQNILANSWADYQYLGLNDIKPSMIAESLENARAAADEFAKNSHSRIGKMRTASQGYFEVEDLDENTPQVKKVRVVTTVEYYLK